MKGYQRRATGKTTWFNLDRYDAERGCWVKSKREYDTEAKARAAATEPGRYRISKATDGQGRTEFEPFTI